MHWHLNNFQTSDKPNPDGGLERHFLVEQNASLIKHLEDVAYRHTHQIIAYIEIHDGVIYSVFGMTTWLHKHGVSILKCVGYSPYYNKYNGRSKK